MTQKPPESQNPFASEPLACRRYGAITYPRISPGSGPHALKANCPDCGGLMKWLSRFTPAEQATRRELARLDAMAQHEPSAAQLAWLKAHGDRAPAPANMAEASQRIDALRRERGVA